MRLRSEPAEWFDRRAGRFDHEIENLPVALPYCRRSLFLHERNLSVMKGYAAKILSVLLLCCPLHLAATAAPPCRGVISARRVFEVRPTPMGVNVYLHLFDMKKYREVVLPAYKEFLRNDNAAPLVRILRECIHILKTHPRLAKELLWNEQLIEEDIGIITGTIYYSPDGDYTTSQGEKKTPHKIRRDYARGMVAANVLWVICVPHDKGVEPAQTMTKSALVSYLYERSEWIKDVFTFVKPIQGYTMELSIGESSESFTKEEIQEFSAELNKVAAPEDPGLRQEYDNLKAMLNLASDNPDLTIILSTL